jgi:hypothetical protein
VGIDWIKGANPVNVTPATAEATFIQPLAFTEKLDATPLWAEPDMDSPKLPVAPLDRVSVTVELAVLNVEGMFSVRVFGSQVVPLGLATDVMVTPLGLIVNEFLLFVEAGGMVKTRHVSQVPVVFVPQRLVSKIAVIVVSFP